MNNNSDDKVHESESAGELDKVNRLLENAASLIDKGDFGNAIDNFEEVVKITHSIFGDSVELSEVKQKIKEIQDALEQLKNI